VAEGFNAYAERAAAELRAAARERGCELRLSLELSNDRLNAKIRACQTRKIPYMLVVGQREADEGTLSIRCRDGKQMPAMKIADFAAYLADKVERRDLEL
jgi:threonyl-tRNA synthetase